MSQIHQAIKAALDISERAGQACVIASKQAFVAVGGGNTETAWRHFHHQHHLPAFFKEQFKTANYRLEEPLDGKSRDEMTNCMMLKKVGEMCDFELQHLEGAIRACVEHVMKLCMPQEQELAEAA